MPERDWVKDWERLNAYLDEEETNPDFPNFAANALLYWLQRVRELEAENARLRQDKEEMAAIMRSVALNLQEFCDGKLDYWDMVADAARKAGAEITRLREQRGIIYKTNILAAYRGWK